MQRSHQRLGVGEALLPCHILVVASNKTALQLHNLTIPVPSGRGAHSKLLTTDSIVVPYENIPVIQTLRVLLLELLDTAAAVGPLCLHALQGSLGLRLGSGKKFLVLGIARDDLPEHSEDQKLVRGMGLQDCRLNDALHHLLQFLHGGIHSRRHLPGRLDLLLHRRELLLQGSHRVIPVGRHIHSHGRGHNDGNSSTHSDPQKRECQKG
mmetsp:Transcript_18826/g.41716  ORF Transcript_18826/g.41716 Transcript_18826/m.41716 type:complete len:209 (+) Transcript_18826:622-1248(+)